MKTSVEMLDPVKVKLTVEVEPARVKKAFDRAARELSKQVSIPGFRPGKAPRRLLEQRIGRSAIVQAAMEEAISEYYVEALEREEVPAVSQPELEVDSFDEQEGCAFTATVEVRPELDPPDHTGITVAFPDWEVDDDAVDEHLELLRDRFAEVEEVERAAKDGDFVTLALRLEVDGVEVEDAAVEDALYQVGSEGVTPKLDEELPGAVAGDELTYVDMLPDEYPEHGGEEATFHVTVKDVRAKTLPELDDDFAATASGFDTLEELREDVRASLFRRRIAEAQHDLRARVLEAYLARVEVELPPSMVEAEKQARIAQLEGQAERLGVGAEELLEAQGTSREQFEERMQEQAQSSVKARLVLDRLAEELEIGVEPSELEEEILRHAQASGVAPERIAEIIREQGSFPALIGDVVRRKTIDAIVAATSIDGGPPDDLLSELGLAGEPEGDATAGDEEASDADTADAPGLIVPGRDEPGEADDPGRRLIVPGQD